eukprot:m.287340 g.287340  ORF g.287340 m.287340 type:complete len:1175 (-) comp15789_c0_seq1:212-3736(-)
MATLPYVSEDEPLSRASVLESWLERTGVRASLASDTVVGMCPDMCPEHERYFRTGSNSLMFFEHDNGTVQHPLMVKKYERAAAVGRFVWHWNVRPVPVLTMTTYFLLHNVVAQHPQPLARDRWTVWYNALRESFRAIRKDIAMQGIWDLDTLHLLQIDFRVHCVAVYLMGVNAQICNRDTDVLEDIVGKMRDCQSHTGTSDSPFAAEMMSYIILDHIGSLFDPSFWTDIALHGSDPLVLQALAVYSCIPADATSMIDYVGFFKAVKKLTFVQACVASRAFNHVRLRALHTLKRGVRANTPCLYSLEHLKKALGYDTLDQVQGLLHAWEIPMATTDGVTTADLSALSGTTISLISAAPIFPVSWINQLATQMPLEQVLNGGSPVPAVAPQAHDSWVDGELTEERALARIDEIRQLVGGATTFHTAPPTRLDSLTGTSSAPRAAVSAHRANAVLTTQAPNLRPQTAGSSQPPASAAAPPLPTVNPAVTAQPQPKPMPTFGKPFTTKPAAAAGTGQHASYAQAVGAHALVAKPKVSIFGKKSVKSNSTDLSTTDAPTHTAADAGTIAPFSSKRPSVSIFGPKKPITKQPSPDRGEESTNQADTLGPKANPFAQPSVPLPSQLEPSLKAQTSTVNAAKEEESAVLPTLPAKPIESQTNKRIAPKPRVAIPPPLSPIEEVSSGVPSTTPSVPGTATLISSTPQAPPPKPTLFNTAYFPTTIARPVNRYTVRQWKRQSANRLPLFLQTQARTNGRLVPPRHVRAKAIKALTREIPPEVAKPELRFVPLSLADIFAFRLNYVPSIPRNAGVHVLQMLANTIDSVCQLLSELITNPRVQVAQETSILLQSFPQLPRHISPGSLKYAAMIGAYLKQVVCHSMGLDYDDEGRVIASAESQDQSNGFVSQQAPPILQQISLCLASAKLQQFQSETRAQDIMAMQSSASSSRVYNTTPPHLRALLLVTSAILESLTEHKVSCRYKDLHELLPEMNPDELCNQTLKLSATIKASSAFGTATLSQPNARVCTDGKDGKSKAQPSPMHESASRFVDAKPVAIRGDGLTSTDVEPVLDDDPIYRAAKLRKMTFEALSKSVKTMSATMGALTLSLQSLAAPEVTTVKNDFGVADSTADQRVPRDLTSPSPNPSPSPSQTLPSHLLHKLEVLSKDIDDEEEEWNALLSTPTL